MPDLPPNLSQAPHPSQEQPAGQQQPWLLPQLMQYQHGGATENQQWQASSRGGPTSHGIFAAVVTVGQPWQAAPGKWQCDVNVLVKNTGICAYQGARGQQ